MAKELEKKIFDEQTLVFTLSQQPQIQGLFMADTPEGQVSYKKVIGDSSGVLYPRRLENNHIIKLCIPGEESLLSRNDMSDMHLFYLKNIVYSALVPDLKIYKVLTIKNKDGTINRKEMVELEFPRAMRNELFSQVSPKSDIDLSRPVLQRRGQIGVTSFDWEYVGTDTYTANRDIRATLSMTMDSMGALTEIRKNKKGQKYRLLDILTPSRSFMEEEKKSVESNKMPKYDSGAYEILIEAGYLIDEKALNRMLAEAGVRSKSALTFADKDIRKAIGQMSFRKMRSCMYLSVVDHQFEFADNGKVDCTVNFIARKDAQDKQPETNILPDVAAKKNIARIEGEIKFLVDTSGGIDRLSESGKKRKKELEGELKKAKQKAAKGFMRKVLEILEKTVELGGTRYPGRIFELMLNEEQAGLFGDYMFQQDKASLADFLASADTIYPRHASPPPSTPPAPKPSTGSGMSGRAAAAAGVGYTTGYNPPPVVEESVTKASFVFFGDLLDAVVTHAGPNYFKDNRYVLGNIEMPDIESPDSAKTRYMPIAGIPISISLLRATMEEKIISAKKQKMTMTQFIKLFTNTVLKEALGRQSVKLFKNVDKKIAIRSFTHYANSVSSDPTRTADDFLDVVSLNPSVATSTVRKTKAAGFAGRSLTGPVKHYDPSKMRIPVVLQRVTTTCSEAAFVKASSQRMLDISIIHEDGNSALYKKVGNLESDFRRQIPHYTHGQSYGLIKSVKLKKDDIPHFAEMRAENSDDNSTDNYLTNVYSATFEMLGNDLNTLGGLIYLDPYGLDPFGSLGDPNDRNSLSFIMGLGGLYLVTKLKHRMEPGKYTTTVTTRFENRGEIKRSSSK